MTFSISLSGLRGAQSELSVTSNNIANVGTVAFKRSRVNFGDIMPPSRSTSGLGTRVSGIDQLFTQGGYQTTSRDLDVAITGDGFFMTRDAVTGGRSYFTRAGAMSVNAEGFLVNAGGGYVQVLPVDPAGVTTARDVAAATALRMPATSGQPRLTTALSLDAQLPATADKPAGRSVWTADRPYAFDPADPASYNFAQTTTLVDAAGAIVPATIYFSRTGDRTAGDPADSWEARILIGGVNATATPIELAFNPDGSISTPAGPVQLDAVSPRGVTGSLAPTISFGEGSRSGGTGFAVSGITQNGFAPSDFASMDIGPDGLVTAAFADGSTQPIGRLLVASFANPAGLRQEGDARWSIGGESGPPRVGIAGDAGIGAIQTGLLETANVDLTEELVGLITAQRNFQANTKAIETANALTQSVLQIR